MKCNYCGKEEVLPFKCQFCGGLFCAEHRLPESHNCSQIGKAKAPREEPPPFEYKVSYAPQRSARKLGFSQTELKHLAIGTLLVSGVGLSMLAPSIESILFMSDVLLALVVLFTLTFLLHEIAHKLVAQRYGMWAEFRIVLFGALLTLASIILPFKFIAPGAVMIAGTADKKTIGRTSIAGPLTNIIFCSVSFALTFVASDPLFTIALLTSAFNGFIAVINLIPVGILDGWKVFEWNKIVWVLAFAASVALIISIFGLYSAYFQLF